MMSTNFFEFREKMTAGARVPAVAKAESAPASGVVKRHAVSVSELTAQIDHVLQTGLPSTVLVRGEVSNCNLHRTSGHLYFTMKDDAACIDCVMWRSDAERLKFKITDGMELLASGSVKVYADRGKYQLYARSLQPVGVGALELAFRQLHARLLAEGLFEASRRKSLPAFPARIAIITSRQTAALQDVLKVLRRFPWVALCVYHVPVQGDGAMEKIADAIAHLNRQHATLGGCDAILLVRGGGSLEDLWAFNEERVARAMVASLIPIVTGIGHEVDTSIADLVADYHAHTPTEAAQVISARWRNASDSLESAAMRLRQGLRNALREARHRLTNIERHETFRRPFERINVLRQRLDDRERSLSMTLAARLRRATARLSALAAAAAQRHPRHQVRLSTLRLAGFEQRLRSAMRSDIKKRMLKLEMTERHLQAIGPEQVLRRGYSITMRKKDGEILRNVKDVRAGEKLVTRLADGTIESIADDANQPRLFE